MKSTIAAAFGSLAFGLLFGTGTSLAQEGPPSANPALSGYWAVEYWWHRRDGGEPEEGARPARPPEPKLTPAAQALVQAAEGAPQPLMTAHNANCWPYSIYGIGFGGGPGRELIAQRPGEVAYVTERWQSLARHIHTDGRGHPADLEPSPNGHSIGHWEGDTLVVETIGFDGKNGMRLVGQADLMPSPDLKVTERFNVIEDGRILLHEMTLEDPTLFAEPYTVVQRRVRDDEQHTAVESPCFPAETLEAWDDRQAAEAIDAALGDDND